MFLVRKFYFVTSSPLKIAVIPGDGTGPEVTAEALKVLAAVSKLEKFTYETQRFDWGGERYLKTINRGKSPTMVNLTSFNAKAINGVKLEWIGEICMTLPRGQIERLRAKATGRARKAASTSLRSPV